jgi:hypothetical protein
MKPLLFSIWNLCFAFALMAQLPDHLKWELNGPSEIDPFPDVLEINALDLGFVADGVTDQSALFNRLISENNEPMHLYFPAGQYLFAGTLRLRSNLRISGSGNETVWLLQAGEGNDGIEIRGNTKNTQANMPSLSRGQDTLPLNVEDGYYYIIDEDSALVYSSWARGSTGQFVYIKDNIIKPGLRRSYVSPDFIEVDPVYNVILEKLRVKRLDETTEQTSSIFLRHARQCRFSCLKLEQSNFSLVEISGSSLISVEGCDFEGAFNHGNGGKAYGVVLQFGSSDCRIENNSFRRLRHSMLLQAGANGNVLAYNYSEKPFWTDVNLPSDAAGDIAMHGNYPYANLIEGNILDNLVIDDSHGKNGPWNVYHNNLIQSYGIVMGLLVATDSQVFVGNVLNADEWFKGLMNLNGSGHLLDGNRLRSGIRSNTKLDLGVSAYLIKAPSFFNNVADWPPESEAEIPASIRIRDSLFTSCEQILKLGVFEEYSPKQGAIYPNPFHDHLYVDMDVVELEIYRLDGIRVLSIGVQKGDVVSLQNHELASGLHLILLKDKDGNIHRRRMLHL